MKSVRVRWQQHPQVGFTKLRHSRSAQILEFAGKHILGLSLSLVVLFLAAPAIFVQPLVIGSISVPKAVEEAGYSRGIVSADVRDEAFRIERATRRAVLRDDLKLSSLSGLPEIEIPSTGMSLPSVVQTLRIFFRRRPLQFEAEIVDLSKITGAQIAVGRSNRGPISRSIAFSVVRRSFLMVRSGRQIWKQC